MTRDEFKAVLDKSKSSYTDDGTTIIVTQEDSGNQMNIRDKQTRDALAAITETFARMDDAIARIRMSTAQDIDDTRADYVRGLSKNIALLDENSDATAEVTI